MRRVLAAILVFGFVPPALADEVQKLTLKDAEARALDSHPQIRAGQYAALAAGEVVRETRSVYFPTVSASFTGAGAQDGSTRIAAGALNNPTILDRFAAGISMSQLLTDFGRTSALTQSETLREDAQEQDVSAVRADVVLNVDRAYFDVLRAQAVLKVAQETVEARQLAVDQITALAASNLKSGLDVSFARVNLGEARLLLAQAQNDVQASYATLTAALGSSQLTTYDLVEEPMPPAPSQDLAALVARALKERPDLQASRLADQSATRFAAAEHRLWFPAISAIGAAGLTPYRSLGLNEQYSAIGLNVTVPVTNGNLFSARHSEAAFHAQEADQALHDLENRVTRDVRVAWLDAQTAYQRVDLTSQVLAEASDALDLAQARYNLGLSSIVELTQAELQKTQAEIDQATARYEYQARSAALNYQLGVRR